MKIIKKLIEIALLVIFITGSHVEGAAIYDSDEDGGAGFDAKEYSRQLFSATEEQDVLRLSILLSHTRVDALMLLRSNDHAERLLHVAIERGSVLCVRVILEKMYQVTDTLDACDTLINYPNGSGIKKIPVGKIGWNAFHYAAARGDVDILQALWESTHKPIIVTATGQSAIDIVLAKKIPNALPASAEESANKLYDDIAEAFKKVSQRVARAHDTCCIN
jgi:hypothetical protein